MSGPEQSLQIGQQLEYFEILSLLGKGGMGEVYRARDTKLNRDVAIKVLPDEFSRDPERVSRFQREAEALAALNRQNIAAIYNVQHSGGIRFRFILYQSTDPKTGTDMWILPMSGAREAQARQGAAVSDASPARDGDRKPFVFLRTNFNERKGQFSPDGRWIAYQSNESGREEIYERPFPEAGGQWQVSTGGGIWVRWRRDGKELYYIAPDGKLMAVAVATQDATFQPGTPVALFQTRIIGGGTDIGYAHQYDVAPDGRFLIVETVDYTTVSPSRSSKIGTPRRNS